MRTIERTSALLDVRRLLRQAPVVALLGPRQVGKTTLARQITASHRGTTTTFDLEDPRDVARLADPMLALAECRGLVVLDEIQRRPDIFPALRVLADRRPLPCRFLVLGSATPELLLKLDRLDVVHAGDDSFPLGPRIQAIPAAQLINIHP